MVNAHSHAFQVDLRGVGERPADPSDDFWSWRTAMFRLAGALDPAAMRDVAARAYARMAAAGYGAVGEFHYVHHQPDGTPYEDPNALAKAVAAAGVAQGLAVVLLPAAYHRNGWDGTDRPPEPGQRRFCDPDAEAFLARVDALRAWAATVPGVHVGIAAHSVRAVPASWLEAIAAYADAHGLVRHVHAAEQVRELEECRAEHGCSPIELLHRTGFLGPRTSVVHAIHVDAADVARLAGSGSIVVTCPTTEGNLGDGHFPALTYRDAGVRLAVGSDSQVRIDPFEEVRELETGARRERRTRHALLAAHGDLWATIADAGRASLGLEDAALPAVEVDLDHPDLAGVAGEDLPLALATCASAGVVVGRARSAPPPAATPPPVTLERLSAADEADFTAAMRASRALHHPWIAMPETPEAFAAYLERAARPTVACFLVRRRDDRAVAGFVTVSEIIRGKLQSAFLGYGGVAGMGGRGYMAAAMRLLLQEAFTTLELHRLEANIQPGNRASIALARGAGFRREGFSPLYLTVDGAWRDHERWAITAEQWRGEA
jgi:formimidoylglutamate deiminase